MKILFFSTLLLLLSSCDQSSKTTSSAPEASRVLASATDLSKVGQCIKKSFTERIETPSSFQTGDDYELSYEFTNSAIDQHSVVNSILEFNFARDRFDSLKLGRNISFKAKNKETKLESCPENTEHVVLNSFDAKYQIYSWTCIGSCVE